MLPSIPSRIWPLAEFLMFDCVCNAAVCTEAEKVCRVFIIVQLAVSAAILPAGRFGSL